MRRRQFLKGALGMAATTVAPVPACDFCGGVLGDHYTWCNDVNPLRWPPDFEQEIPALVPKFQFSNDPDTGIYSAGADQLNLVAGGVRQLVDRTAAKVFDRAFAEEEE